MIELEIISGVAQGQHLKTNAPFVSVGRSPEHTIVIADPRVSRHHGEFLFLGTGYQYRDLNSTHGTILNRNGDLNLVRQVVLRDGDELNFGGTDNRLVVLHIALEEVDRRERTITTLHAPEDKFSAPEDLFAHDSKALRTLVEFDSRIMDSSLLSERQLFRALLEHIPRLFDDLEYVAIVDWTDDGPQPYDYELVNPEGKVRLSSTLIALARRKGRGIVYEVNRDEARVSGGIEATLSERSQILELDTGRGSRGICVPVGGRRPSSRFLQFERAGPHRGFREEDVGLVSSMVLRVADRVDNLNLVQQNQRLSHNASLGVFAGMIGHDIKNYLFYSKKLSEIRNDSFADHPGIIKGIDRARKLAQGMKDLAAPGKVTLSTFSLRDFVQAMVDEFNSLFGKLCTFEMRVEDGLPPVTTSEDLLNRVVWNLVMNAYHSTENRPRSMTEPPWIRIRVKKGEEDSLIVKVADNAGGIGPKTLEYIQRSFDMIRRAYQRQEDLLDVVNEMSFMGGFTNSIGLFFTAVATNDLNGTIAVKTRERQGSVFTVQIPITIDQLKNLLRF